MLGGKGWLGFRRRESELIQRSFWCCMSCGRRGYLFVEAGAVPVPEPGVVMEPPKESRPR